MHFFGIARYHDFLRLKGERSELYLNRLMRALALSLIAVFIPIYLLNIGYSLNDVFIFLILQYVFFAIFCPVAALLEEKIGNKHLIALASPMYILFLVMIFSTQDIGWPIALIGAVHGFSWAIYWIPFNSYFTIHTDRHHRGQSIGILAAIPNVPAIFGPLVGALIISAYDFSVAIIVASMILFVSLFPLFLTGDHKVKIEYAWRKTFSKRNSHFFRMFLAKGFIAAAITIWPLYLYVTKQEYLFVGLASTIKGAGVGIFTLMIGNFSDKFSKRSIIRIGGASNFGIWIAAIFATTMLELYIVSFLIGFLFILISIPLLTMASNEAVKQDVAEFFVLREMTFCLAFSLMFTIGLILSPDIRFKVMFIIAAFAALYFVLPFNLQGFASKSLGKTRKRKHYKK